MSREVTVMRVVLALLLGLITCSWYFWYSNGTSELAHTVPSALSSLKDRVQQQKLLRREFLSLLGDQLDQLQDQMVSNLERDIAQHQLNPQLPNPLTAQPAAPTPKIPKPAATAAPAPVEPSKTLVAPAPAAPAPAPKAPSSEGEPGWLLHRAEVSGIDAVVGFAAYPRNILDLFRSFVLPLRAGGYEGHIILGCRRELDASELSFLKEHRVTAYAIDLVPCELPWMKNKDTSKKEFESESERIRGVCVRKYPSLKMEWARFQLGADWLEECPTCQGWNLITDFRDVTFQTGKPFELLEQYKAKYDLLLVEEWFGSPHGMSNQHWFSWASMHVCYGAERGEQIVKPYKPKPVVCSGTVLGNRAGIKHYAAVMTAEFLALNKLGEKCVTPHVVDQAVQIRIFYEGRFGERATALKYGEGPVLTVGGACANATHHSMDDVLRKDAQGFVLNNNGARAPIVHQYDRCHLNYAPFVRDVDRFVQQVAQGEGASQAEPNPTVTVTPAPAVVPLPADAKTIEPTSQSAGTFWSPPA